MECGPFVFRAHPAVFAVAAFLMALVLPASLPAYAIDVRLAQVDQYDDRSERDYVDPYDGRGDPGYDDPYQRDRDSQYRGPVENDYESSAGAGTYFDDDQDGRRQDEVSQQGKNRLLQDLTHFVQHDYLGNGRLNHISDVSLFAPRVDYYGRKRITRAAVDASRHSYYRKWSQRRYELIPGSMEIRQRGQDSVDVRFDYNFELAGRRKHIRGVGRTKLTVRQRYDDGAFEITRENGRVLRRY